MSKGSDGLVIQLCWSQHTSSYAGATPCLWLCLADFSWLWHFWHSGQPKFHFRSYTQWPPRASIQGFPCHDPELNSSLKVKKNPITCVSFMILKPAGDSTAELATWDDPWPSGSHFQKPRCVWLLSSSRKFLRPFSFHKLEGQVGGDLTWGHPFRCSNVYHSAPSLSHLFEHKPWLQN